MSPEQGPGVPGTVLNGTQSNKVGLAGSKAVNAKFDDAINANLVWGGGGQRKLWLLTRTLLGRNGTGACCLLCRHFLVLNKCVLAFIVKVGLGHVC